MIKLQIVGNLGKDCIIKEVNGKNVINFSVAHTERFKDAQGIQKERTTWVECAYWTDRTTVGQWLVKGKMVYVEGTPEADGYLNKDGQPAATLRLRVTNLQLLGGSGDNSSTTSGSNSGDVTNKGINSSAGSTATPVARTESDSGVEEDGLPF